MYHRKLKYKGMKVKKMKLFTVGPVEMSSEIRQIGGMPIPYFRTDDFSEVMFQIQDMFLELLDAPENSKLITLTASGTGGMEAAVSNLFDQKDKLLVINGGSFGKRFAQLCQCFQIPYDELFVDFEQDLTEEMLAPYENRGYTGLLVNIDETSIGKLYDYKLLGDFCEKNNMYFVVDAISSFLADELSMIKGNIDAVILSSQKALALPPGLSYVALSERITRERVGKIAKKSLYFDFQDYLKNMERGQTPFTPAVGIVLQTEYRLKEILRVGLDRTIERHKELAQYFRQGCQENGIKVVPFQKSNAVTAIDLDDKAKIVFTKAKEEYDMMLTPNGGEFQNRILRIGHLGNLKKQDYDEVIKVIRTVLEEEK